MHRYLCLPWLGSMSQYTLCAAILAVRAIVSLFTLVVVSVRAGITYTIRYPCNFALCKAVYRHLCLHWLGSMSRCLLIQALPCRSDFCLDFHVRCYLRACWQEETPPKRCFG